MTNPLYTDSAAPVRRSAGASAPIRSQFAAIEDAFDKIIPHSSFSGHGNKVLKVNNGETAMELVDTDGYLDGQTHKLGYVRETTWTPTVTFETPGSLALTYPDSRKGHYYRVGKKVRIECEVDFNISDKTGASGGLRITGLPFASDVARVTAIMPCQLFGSALLVWPSGVTTLYGYIEAGTDYFEIFGNGDGGANSSFGVSVFPTGVQLRVRIMGEYMTAAA
jgi:hypothetical protein